jgi:hypothetical protein
MMSPPEVKTKHSAKSGLSITSRDHRKSMAWARVLTMKSMRSAL